MTTETKGGVLANASKIVGVIVTAVVLMFGSNLLSRCDALHTDAEAATESGHNDARMDRLEASVERMESSLTETAAQVKVLFDRDARNP